MTLRKDKIRAKPADSGQTLVEFAIAAMVFLLLLFATIDFGYLYYVKVTLQHAVRQAGRYAITGNCSAGTNCFLGGSTNRYNSIIQVALTYSFGLITASNISITCLPPYWTTWRMSWLCWWCWRSWRYRNDNSYIHLEPCDRFGIEIL